MSNMTQGAKTFKGLSLHDMSVGANPYEEVCMFFWYSKSKSDYRVLAGYLFLQPNKHLNNCAYLALNES